MILLQGPSTSTLDSVTMVQSDRAGEGLVVCRVLTQLHHNALNTHILEQRGILSLNGKGSVPAPIATPVPVPATDSASAAAPDPPSARVPVPVL